LLSIFYSDRMALISKRFHGIARLTVGRLLHDRENTHFTVQLGEVT
jgi:hypothetical protein